MKVPWRVCGWKGVMVNADMDEGGEMTICLFPGESLEEAQRNAALISAAPELLEALEYLVADLQECVEDRNPETGEEYASVTKAIEAIQLAKPKKGGAH